MSLRISRDGRPFDRRLLHAARNERPASGAEDRALAVLGLSTTLAIGATKPPISSKLALGWGATTLLVAGLAAGIGVAWVLHSRPDVRAPARAVVAISTRHPDAQPPSTVLPSAPSSEPSVSPPATSVPDRAPSVASPVAVPIPARARAARTAPVATAPLSGEVALVQQAARALASGEPGVALGVLDSYRSQYPRGALAEEAGVLRAQALARVGEATQARALAERLLAADPHGVFAGRLHEVLGEVAVPPARGGL
jgi:hypothetical protein